MADTAKKNFGGGNTAWEEKTLSKYEFSEVRLMEILEGLCGSSDFECNTLLEENEEHLEDWWLRLQKQHPDLMEWFCVQALKVCCSPGTYGPRCLECPGGSQRPCGGNGRCGGDGTRQGDGLCQCHAGYRGELCLDCSDGYFSSLRNQTHSVCTACDQSCKTCTGPTNEDCSQCEVGWERKGEACLDVDECVVKSPACSERQFCLNTNGSFSCEDCDSTCVGCTGKGPEHCKECISGYVKDEGGKCEDVDECALAEKACRRRDENCYNTPGSFVCVCPDGYEETDDACVPTPTPAMGTETPGEGGSAPREDL